MATAPLVSQVVSDMLTALRHYLPAQAPPLPPPSVFAVSVEPRALGLGNWRGNETRASQPIVALKGGRLDAVVRFQLWASDVTAADTAVSSLQSRVLAAAGSLRSAGFLRLAVGDVSSAEQVSTLNAWRETATYRVLYEYQYDDSEDAASLIARIPIDIDSEFAESMVVTDEMMRWDDHSASPLELSGGVEPPTTVHEVVTVAHLPAGWNGSAVSINAAVGGPLPPWQFASLRSFLGAFAMDPGTVTLEGNPYQTGRLAFPNAHFPSPIVLATLRDEFRIAYASPALTTGAVVYLRVR